MRLVWRDEGLARREALVHMISPMRQRRMIPVEPTAVKSRGAVPEVEGDVHREGGAGGHAVLEATRGPYELSVGLRGPPGGGRNTRRVAGFQLLRGAAMVTPSTAAEAAGERSESRNPPRPPPPARCVCDAPSTATAPGGERAKSAALCGGSISRCGISICASRTIISIIYRCRLLAAPHDTLRAGGGRAAHLLEGKRKGGKSQGRRVWRAPAAPPVCVRTRRHPRPLPSPTPSDPGLFTPPSQTNGVT